MADVYTRIAAVSAELSKDGISKSRKNQAQGYSFRGIDEVLNALAPLLAKHGLVILPRILSRECTEREAKSGGVLFSVTVSAAFDFVAASDGSSHTVQTFGEAMDSADKATNKAMSAAYKYAAFLAFCIPTEGDNDADAHTPEAGARVAQAAPATVTHARVATISEPQQKRFFAISKQHGWQGHEVKAMLKRVLGVESSAEIPVHRYDEVCKLLETGVEAIATR
jgi:hypothetical protein